MEGRKVESTTMKIRVDHFLSVKYCTESNSANYGRKMVSGTQCLWSEREIVYSERREHVEER